MIGELLVRFLAGGALVALFALLGDVFSPKSFAGIFAGAPPVALATLTLTVRKEGAAHVAVEARSMVFGAIAFVFYTGCLSLFLHRRRTGPIAATLAWLPLWFAVAAGGFALALRGR
jgi:hypothetical protein